MCHNTRMKQYLLTIACSLFALATLAIEIPGKKIYIPRDLRGNDFENDSAQWSYSRMALTDNFVIFWEKGFGKDINNPPRLEGRPMRVDIENMKQKLERFYQFYRDTLQFIGAGSNADKYRMMVMINYSLEGTAYGGDYDEVIGAFWSAPNRLQDMPLNTVAHELGHSFQMQVHCDRKVQAKARGERLERWSGGGFFEMTSQWMLWHVNPNWVRDELYHWDAYRRTPHKAFLHWENVYHSPYVLEWWSQNYGLEVIGNIYKEGKGHESPVEVMMRLTKMNASQFNDNLFEAHRHTIFLDFKHARNETRPFAGNWPQLPEAGAPEPGGFDARKLPVPDKGKRIKVEFQGHTEDANEGWRYGFVALMDDGTCQYSPIYKKGRARVSYKAPKDKAVRELYLVVMNAPQNWPLPPSRRHDEEPRKTSSYEIRVTTGDQP